MAAELTFSKETERLIEIALTEDIGSGDITSISLIPPDAQGGAVLLSREALLVCGHPVAEHVFRKLDPAVSYKPLVGEGEKIEAGTVLAEISGPLASILAGERTALNFLQRLSGIATRTAELQANAGPDVRILDTRKTAPGMRQLDKYAVMMGGGTNHRTGLYDMVLIKNNHIDAMGGDFALAVKLARERSPKGTNVEVEVRSEIELARALEAQPDIILLDNFSPADLKAAVAIARNKAPAIKLEASGGINDATLIEYAQTGVDYLSIGALTHSVRGSDISLRVEKDKRYPR